MITTFALLFCRLTIAFLFLFSSGRKLLAFSDFAVTIGDFKLLPRRWSKTVASLFVTGEITTVGLLTFGDSLLLPGFLLALLLLIIFCVALATALRRNIKMSCSCFGRTERQISRYDVARNFLFLLYGLSGLYLLRYSPQNLPGNMLILLVLMSVVFLLFATNLEDIVETLRQPFPVHEERR